MKSRCLWNKSIIFARPFLCLAWMNMMKEYKTYIFDLDGTLLNTLDDLTTSTNYAMRYAGLPEYDSAQIRSFVGNGVRKLIERAVPGGLSYPRYEEVLAVFKSHYSEHSMDATVPYEGILPMLSSLHDSKKHLAVVSNKFYDATRHLCSHFFGDYMEVAIGERSNIRKKPAPDTVMEALRQLGVEKDGAVYVGDSEVDLETAKNCGIPCVSVLWGFRNRDYLIRHGAETLIERPEELLRW